MYDTCFTHISWWSISYTDRTLHFNSLLITNPNPNLKPNCNATSFEKNEAWNNCHQSILRSSFLIFIYFHWELKPTSGKSLIWKYDYKYNLIPFLDIFPIAFAQLNWTLHMIYYRMQIGSIPYHLHLLSIWLAINNSIHRANNVWFKFAHA